MRRPRWDRHVVTCLRIDMLAVLEMEPNGPGRDQEGLVVLCTNEGGISAELKESTWKLEGGPGSCAHHHHHHLTYHFMPMWRWTLRVGWNGEFRGSNSVI